MSTDTETTDEQPPSTETNGQEAPPETPPSTDVDELQRALANERKRWEKAERELAALRKSQMDDNERAVAEAKEAGRAEAWAEVNSRLLAAEVRAIAADRLADPSDAVRLLDLDGLANEDGSPDAKAITAALDTLVKAKPYLAKQQGPAPPTSRVPQGARDGAPSHQEADDFLRSTIRRHRV